MRPRSWVWGEFRHRHDDLRHAGDGPRAGCGAPCIAQVAPAARRGAAAIADAAGAAAGDAHGAAMAAGHTLARLARSGAFPLGRSRRWRPTVLRVVPLGRRVVPAHRGQRPTDGLQRLLGEQRSSLQRLRVLPAVSPDGARGSHARARRPRRGSVRWPRAAATHRRVARRVQRYFRPGAGGALPAGPGARRTGGGASRRRASSSRPPTARACSCCGSRCFS